MVSTNKRPTESFLVGTDTALQTSGNLNSGVNFNLANGQMGFVSQTHGSNFNTFIGVDATTDRVRLYQGNSNSASMATASSTYPLWVRPYEVSNPIDVNLVQAITKQAYREPSNSTWVIGNAVNASNTIVGLGLTEFTINIALRGRRIAEYYSAEQAANVRVSHVTPDVTGWSDVKKVNNIITNLAYSINKNSQLVNGFRSGFGRKAPVVAFLVDTTGAYTPPASSQAIGGRHIKITGGTTGTTAQIVAGQTFVILKDGSTEYSITLTSQIVTSLQNAMATAVGSTDPQTWKIVPINTANFTAETVGTAGATGNPATGTGGNVANVLIVMGLDEPLAYVDYIPQVKTKLEVGLPSGFNYLTVRNIEGNKADEGQGLGRVLDLMWKATQGQRLYTLRHVEDPVVNFPSPINTSSTYTVYNILHGNTEQIDTTNFVYSPYREVICVPSGSLSNLDLDTPLGHLAQNAGGLINV